MTSQRKIQIDDLRRSGASFAQIAEKLNMPLSTIKSYCYRNPLQPIAQETQVKLCQQCGKPLTPSRFRPRRFCSDACRYKYWSLHKFEGKTTVIDCVCQHCGRVFTDYAQRRRKYCCHACYITARYGVQRHD